MRLHELTLPKNHHRAFDALVNAGYKPLGSGSYAKVVQKTGMPYVLKLFTPADTAYEAFVRLCMAHPNKHFPKFYGKIVDVGGFKAVRLEPLASGRSEPLVIDAVRAASRYLSSSPDSTHGLRPMNGYFEEHPEFQEACRLIKDNLLGRFNEDIHQGNIMLRGTTPVITDPVERPGAVSHMRASER